MCSAAYGNFYILSSWRSGVFSSCCLALDSSSSFPCPAFRAITKSPIDSSRFFPLSVKFFTILAISDMGGYFEEGLKIQEKGSSVVTFHSAADRFKDTEENKQKKKNCEDMQMTAAKQCFLDIAGHWYKSPYSVYVCM
ncbi:hypothetical protein STEG23_018304, partial [Scotinomys teguina]